MRKHIQRSWGKTHSSESTCFYTSEFSQDFTSKYESGLAIGFGRSYGDSSINSKGIYLEVPHQKKIEFETQQLQVTCSADVSIGELERAALSKGLFPLTVPGTEYVSIGGAVASNIHGKSHHKFGTFGQSLIELELLTSNGQILSLRPNGSHSDIFWATVGGMGLTGVITKVKLQLRQIETSYIVVKEKRVKNLRDLLDTLKTFDQEYDYTVAWVDLSGKFQGRGRVLGGNHAQIGDLEPQMKNKPINISLPRKYRIPKFFPSWFISSSIVRIFNFLWFYKPLAEKSVDIREFLHPLDSVRDWNNIYGKQGMIQFQFQIPFDSEYFLNRVFDNLKSLKIASFLGVLKQFGSNDSSYLGFPSSGWTLAVDLPARRRDAIPILHELITELIELKGKVYLTKDSLMTHEEFKQMYKNYDKWREVKKKIDPINFWKSDQGRRLGLC